MNAVEQVQLIRIFNDDALIRRRSGIFNVEYIVLKYMAFVASTENGFASLRPQNVATLLKRASVM
jgi:hypothetical protein